MIDIVATCERLLEALDANEMTIAEVDARSRVLNTMVNMCKLECRLAEKTGRLVHGSTDLPAFDRRVLRVMAKAVEK